MRYTTSKSKLRTMTKYKIIRKIGAGSFGNVYELRTGNGNSKTFALKTVNTLRLTRNGHDACTEGSLMLKLCHTHLVHCYDAFQRSPQLYLVMELCSHGSLEQLLQGRKTLVPESQICSWMTQMADVLRYLYALKVIHRDLKPANIFLDGKENIKLGDLGVARELDYTVQERHTSAGTLPYMSPEVLTGLPYNFKTDIWSLGCCIHETMTLRKTFQGRSWTELHDMVMSAKVPDMPSFYQPKLRQLVLSLLTVESDRRPDTLQILHELFQIQGKRFSSEPFKPLDSLPFDQRQICLAVKEFEMSSESDIILPLGATTDSSDSSRNTIGRREVSKLSQGESDLEDHSTKEDRHERGERLRGASRRTGERGKDRRSLPVPGRKSQTKAVRLAEDRVKRQNESNNRVIADDNSFESGCEDHVSQRLLSTDSFPGSSYSHHPAKGNSNLGASQPDPNEWTERYVDALTRDSIQWLRQRFKPKGDTGTVVESQPNGNSWDRQSPRPDSDEDDDNDDDDNEEDDDEAAGLVTLFTQSQTAVFINWKSHHSDAGNDVTTP